MTTETRRQIIEEPFGVTPERMFDVLTTPTSIRNWWGASSVVIDARAGGSWIAASGEGEKDADYISSFVIMEFEPPTRMLLGSPKYYTGNNWPIQTNMTTEFLIERQPTGCILRIVQELTPADPLLDDFFDACIAGWQNSFEGIRNYLHNHPTD